MTAPRPEIDMLRQTLGAMLGKPLSIDALSSGTGGASFLVAAPAGHYVAKVFADDSQALVGPAEQYEIMRQAAAAGIAPEPAGFDPELGVLVTEYVDDAAAVTAEELRRPERIAVVADLLRALHAVPAAPAAFSPAAYAQRYLVRIGGRSRLSRDDCDRFDELIELAEWSIPGTACLCHNDLTADNLLLGAAPKLIDFDYAVMASPLVDLASVSVMNSFRAAETSALLDAYFGRSLPLSQSEFARVQCLVRLLAHFWALASQDAGAAIVAHYRIRDD